MIEGGEPKNQEIFSPAGKDQAAEKSGGSCMLVAFAALLFWLPALFMKLGRQVFGTAKVSGIIPTPNPERCTDTVEKKLEPPPGSASLIHTVPVSSTGRSSQCSESDERDLKLPTRSEWPFASFLIAMVSGLGFIFAYWTDWPTAALGVSLAIFFGGIGVTLILWSHRLVSQSRVVQQREQLHPPQQEHEQLTRDLECANGQIARRGILKSMCAACVGVVALMGASLLRSLGPNPKSELYAPAWKPGQRLVDFDGKPLSTGTLQTGSTIIAFPEGRVGDKRAQVVLLRVPSELLQLPQDRRHWAPLGHVAYSRVCTHAACAVGMYDTTTHELMCPCHQSTFNVLQAAEPSGGPAARSLPQLPLYVDVDGSLRAGGDFSEPPGPEFWGMS